MKAGRLNKQQHAEREILWKKIADAVVANPTMSYVKLTFMLDVSLATIESAARRLGVQRRKKAVITVTSASIAPAVR